ncbi:MAG: hypothetical protein RI560_08670 [Natronomonas sp.]|nr:hypothetical protein [Natronomonas sp.]
MTKPQGPIRGMLGRWVMRFEAAGQMLGLVFQGTTAVSALSGVLAFVGYQSYVPAVLGGGIAAVFAFAFAYVELGVYNRKNREKQDRGNNFAKPQNRIDDEMIARGVAAGMHGRALSADEREAINGELDDSYRKHRNGIEVR